MTAIDIGKEGLSPDNFLRNELIGDKQRRIILYEGIAAIVNHVFSISLGKSVEVLRGLILVGPRLIGSGIDMDILAEGSLIEEETGCKSLNDILADDRALICLELAVHYICARKFEVLGHHMEYILTVIARSVKDSGVSRLHIMLYPRNIGEELDSGHIVVCSPETGNSLIMVVDFLRDFLFCP